MKHRLLAILLAAMFISAVSYAADDQASPVTLATPSSTGGQVAPPPSLGAQAGEAARDLKGTADESLSTGAIKVAEASAKVQTEAQDTLKTLQQQWDVIAKQLREKTQQIQKQLDQQWQDFNKSFNKKPQP
jgi:exonuclease VII large subunit